MHLLKLHQKRLWFPWYEKWYQSCHQRNYAFFRHNILPWNKLFYFTSHRKSQKPVKAVLRHLPYITSAEEICEVLVDDNFEIMSVKQMSANRWSDVEWEPITTNVRLLFVTLTLSVKS
jgi:hypothetical protein